MLKKKFQKEKKTSMKNLDEREKIDLNNSKGQSIGTLEFLPRDVLLIIFTFVTLDFRALCRLGFFRFFFSFLWN